MAVDIKKKQIALHEKWRAGNSHARLELLKTLRGQIETQVARMRNTSIPRSDLRSEATLAALEAIEVWDPDRGSLSSCAFPRIKNALLNLARSSSGPAITSKSRKDRKLRWKLPDAVARYESNGIPYKVAIKLASDDLELDPALCDRYMQSKHSTDIESCQLVSDEPGGEERLLQKQVSRIINEKLLAGISDFEKELVNRLLSDCRKESIESIGKRYGLSRNQAERKNANLMQLLRERAIKLNITPSMLYD